MNSLANKINLENTVQNNNGDQAWRDYTATIAWPTLSLLAVVIGVYAMLWHFAAAIPTSAMMLALTVNAYMSFTVLHEAGHGNIFASDSGLKHLEPLVGWIACIPLLVFPYKAFKIVHDRHHAFTNHPDLDPDYYGEMKSWGQIILHCASIPYRYYRMCTVVLADDPQVQAGIANTHKVFVLLAVLFSAMIMQGYALALLLFILIPAVTTLVVITLFFDYIPHQPHRNLDRFRNTRAFPGRLYNALMLGQNYHLMHHMYPRVPWYAYRPLYHRIERFLKQHGSPLETLFTGDYPRLFQSDGGASYLDKQQRVNMVMRVKKIETAAASAMTIEFAQPDGQSLQYQAGQYLVLSKRLGNQQVQRCYSIYSAPADKRLSIAAKNTGGVFSTFINESLAVGDDMLVHGPYGQFCLPQVPPAEIVLFAAGSGITPILSIARQALLGSANSKLILLYASPSLDQMMFYPELVQLANQYPERLQLELFLTRKDTRSHKHHGRLNRGKIQSLLFSDSHYAGQAQFYLCGPQALRVFIEETLIDLGVSPQAIHCEAFVEAAVKPQGKLFDVTLNTRQGLHQFSVAENQTLLEAAKQQNIFIPNACGEGMCGSCKVFIRNGDSQRVSEDCVGLLHQEQEDGVSLACQCRPLSNIQADVLND